MLNVKMDSAKWRNFFDSRNEIIKKLFLLRVESALYCLGFNAGY